MDSFQRLHANTMCLTRSIIENVKKYQQFGILVANFSGQMVDILPHQVLKAVAASPEILVESHLLHTECRSLISNDIDKKFLKRHPGAQNIETTNKHLTDYREHQMWKEQNPFTAEYISTELLKYKEVKFARCRRIMKSFVLATW